MSALSEAIRGRRPDTTLATRSPLHGLRRGSIGTADVVAQSVAAVAPAGVLLTHAGGLMREVGSFVFIATVATAACVILVSMSLAVFARRIAAAGGVYTFVTRGLGPIAGMAAGAAIAIGYAAMSIDTLRSGVRRLERLLTGTPPGATSETGVLTIALIVAVSAGVVAVIIVGARISTRIMLVVEIVAVTAILSLSISVFAASGWDLAPLLPTGGSAPSMSAFASGAALALASFVGFESGAALAPETRRPLAAVPRALVWTTVALAVVYLFGVAAQLSGSASGSVGRTSSLLGDALGARDAAWFATATDAVIAASWIACTLACTNALVRLVFTLARERVLPRGLGATLRGSGTPHKAAIAVGIVVAAGTVTLSFAGRDSLYGATVGAASSFGFLLAYLFVCVAAAVYLLRIGEFTWREAWPAIVAAGLLAVAVTVEIYGTDGEAQVAVSLVLAVVAAAAAVHARMISIRGSRLLGAYDMPTAGDAIAPSRPGLRRGTAVRR